MASLKQLIEEIDLVNDKLERMRELLKDIHVGWDALPERAAQLMREPERPFAGASISGIYHECGNCGVPRFEHDGILEKCPNCGDDEIDLSQETNVP